MHPYNNYLNYSEIPDSSNLTQFTISNYILNNLTNCYILLFKPIKLEKIKLELYKFIGLDT